MEKELEAVFLEINKEDIRKKLKNIGAVCVFPKTLFKRYTFDIPGAKEGKWVRVREEANKTTITIKHIAGHKSIHDTREAEIEVNSLEDGRKFLLELGMIPAMYEENYREEWEKDGVKFDIDTWPLIPTYLEIEGKDENSVKKWSGKLGLDYGKGIFGSAGHIYRKYYNIDIFKLKRLTFEEQI